MKVIDSGIQIFKDKNFIINRHNSTYYALQLFWSSISTRIDGKDIVLPPHTLLIVDKDAPQYFQATGDAMINDYVVFSAEKKELDGLILNKPITLSRPEQYHNILRFIDMEHRSANARREETAGFMLQGLLSKCKDLFDYYELESSAVKTRDAFVQLRADILNFPYWSWNIPEMAKRCNLSTSRFQRAYKKLFSISPMADVVNARILTAKIMLSSNQTIKEIAAQCGYKSDVHFMNQFKKITGKTPSEYRKNGI